jgi:hypothetical protein
MHSQSLLQRQVRPVLRAGTGPTKALPDCGERDYRFAVSLDQRRRGRTQTHHLWRHVSVRGSCIVQVTMLPIRLFFDG